MKLEVVRIACGYDDKKILSDVSFTVNTGEVCCLLGPNGVGKTTLFKTVLKLLRPLEGEVRIDGQDISRWSASKLAKRMAYVSQYHVPPFPYLVRDVVMLGRINSVGYFGTPSDHDHMVCEKAMEDLGIRYLRDKVYTDISGGERQLVMIARALAQEPDFLVLDEPTASLDYGNTIRVLKQIRTLRDKGYGIIMTTHNPDHAFMCNSSVVLLQRDRPVLFGPAADILTDQNLYDAYKVRIRVIRLSTDSGWQMNMCVPME